MQNICVYCGSSSQVDDAFFEASKRLGALIASNNMALVYGAGAVGLMGKIADSVLDSGGKVIGVIPRFMVDEGWCREGLTELHILENMHERKRKMAELADAVVAMPGGCGTLEELMEIITWKQLGLFDKPVVIMNINGYYDDLIKLLNRAVTEKFMREKHARMWEIVRSAEEVIPAINAADKWDINFRKFAAI